MVILMLYLVAWLTDFAAIMFIFVSTRALAEEKASILALGILGACYAFASGVANTVSGRLADRVGRRPVSLLGTGLFFLGMLAAVNALPGSVAFYAAYMVVGCSLGLIYPPVMAWLGQDRVGTAASRTYLYFCLAFNLGIACGQLGGGWMFEQLGSAVPVYVAMGLVAVSFTCLLFMRETAPRPSPAVDLPVDSSVFPELARAFSRLSWMANFSGMFSMSILWFLLPHLFVQLKIPADSHGLVLAVGRGVVIMTFVTMHFVPGWRYRFRYTALFHLLGILGLCGILWGSSILVLTISVCVFSILMGYNYFSSLFYSSTGNRNERKGRAFGWNEAFLGFGALGGSLLGGWIGSANLRSPYLLAAVVVGLSFGVQGFVYWTRVRPLRKQLWVTGD
jgi:MFS family permease